MGDMVAARMAGALAGAFLLVCSASANWARAATPPPLEIYGQLPKTEAVDLSADGSLIAAIETIGDQRMLTIRKPDGSLLADASVGNLKLFGLQWAGNDYVVVYTHQTARLVIGQSPEQEFMQGVVLSAKDGSAKPLLRQSGDYLPAIFGRYGFRNEGGHWVGYCGVVPTERPAGATSDRGFFKQRYPDLYRVDLEAGTASRVTRGTAYERSWVVDTNSQIAAESEYDPNDGAWKVFLPGARSQPLLSGTSKFGFGLDGLGRTAGTVLVETGGDDSQIVELHLDSGRTESFLPSGKAMELIHSPASHLLLGAVLVDDNQSLVFGSALDRRFQSIVRAFRSDALRLVSVNDDMSKIVVHVQGKETAGTWQLVNFKTGRADPLADDYPGIADTMIGETKLFNYSAADGLALQGVLTLPPGAPARNLPIVVMPHSSLDTRDRVGFDWWAQAFASRGYAVFQPNFRGSSGYGAAFRNAGDGQLGRKMQTDISDGLQALAAQGIVDPKRACIVGAYQGGYAALAGVTLQHGIYRCAASYGGVSDQHHLLSFLHSHDLGDAHRYWDASMRYLESYLGVQSTRDDALDEISPQNHAKDADAPILLIHGENDTVVPIVQSEDMESALKRAGKTVEFVKLDGEDHWLSRSATRLEMLKAMMAFVEKYDPPDGAAMR